MDHLSRPVIFTDQATEFKPLPKRWFAERSFAWSSEFRRVAKDYEKSVEPYETMIYIASIAPMIKFL